MAFASIILMFIFGQLINSDKAYLMDIYNDFII